MTKIPKIAERVETCLRSTYYVDNARSGLRAILNAAGSRFGNKVLLPAYIGWSEREGSGVMDPVKQAGFTPVFYRMTPQLEIDVDDLRFQIRNSSARIFVIVHYFGFPDSEYRTVCDLARNIGMLVIEDEAHAMFSDLIGGVCGRLGDFAIMSLHKLLPFKSGGLLLANSGADRGIANEIRALIPKWNIENAFWEYDAFAIARKRRSCATVLSEMLAGFDEIELLKPVVSGVVPQTLPIVLKRGHRDTLYYQLNAVGYGVVSLYHTMVSDLDEAHYPDAHWLGKRILNLPVHQDVDEGLLAEMVTALKASFR